MLPCRIFFLESETEAVQLPAIDTATVSAVSADCSMVVAVAAGRFHRLAPVWTICKASECLHFAFW